MFVSELDNLWALASTLQNFILCWQLINSSFSSYYGKFVLKCVFVLCVESLPHHLERVKVQQHLVLSKPLVHTRTGTPLHVCGNHHMVLYLGLKVCISVVFVYITFMYALY
jgi:hypothetical protein